MKATHKPVSEARRNRGTGNDMLLQSSDYFSTEACMARRKAAKLRGEKVYGTFVHVEGVGSVELSEAIRKYNYNINKISRRQTSGTINIKNYEHINRSFKNWNTPTGRYIASKADYEKALEEEGMLTEDQALKAGMVDPGEKKGKEYKVTKDTLDLIESVKATQDSKGNIHPGDRAIERLIGNKKQYNPEALPNEITDTGGFKEDK